VFGREAVAKRIRGRPQADVDAVSFLLHGFVEEGKHGRPIDCTQSLYCKI
jgi:hypothetical protein